MGFIRKLSLLVLVVAVSVSGWMYLVTRPGPTGFGFYSTSEEVVPPGLSLQGKNAIVTGGYGGIGLKTVERLAFLGASIWLPARPSSMKICEKAAADLTQLTGNKNLFCEPCDLGSLHSVASFANKWAASSRPLHLLINNAAIMAAPYAESVDGFELQFATNHLGHFLLTTTLMDNLRKGAPSRVVTVSSDGHKIAPVNLDDLTGKGTWHTGSDFITSYLGPWRAYGQSKTANILFSYALNKRLAGYGTSNSLHPGVIMTGLGRHVWSTNSSLSLVLDNVPFFKSVTQGAATQLFVALSPQLEGYGGRFFMDCNVSPVYFHADDFEMAEKLWAYSEKTVAPFRTIAPPAAPANANVK